MVESRSLSWVAVAFVVAALPVTLAMSLATGTVSDSALAGDVAYVSARAHG